jgi:hypothetical protein
LECRAAMAVWRFIARGILERNPSGSKRAVRHRRERCADRALLRVLDC